MHGISRLLASLLFIFFFCASLGHSQEAQQQTLYNFGTMQESSGLVAAPGENITLNLYFFMDEKYGNRITHVIANVEEIPPGWMIGFDPPVGISHLNVSGILVDSTENLYVTPRSVLSAVPESKEPGIFYLKSPSGKGYLQAKRLQVKVRVPADAQLGNTYSVKVAADGFWFGNAGSMALKQSRTFNYAITVANKEYTEQILAPEKAPERAEQNGALDMNQLLVYILGAAVAILAAYIVVSRKRK